ncbi:KaiC domain-containing protein [Haloarculaceae archaeon H-GB2-1]|nr:KaiC domain-containing protein [Haloarculaceae archaeon H-GB1-1]MEA5389107.1 KaiC domain-containing protein [Haloarculaceae archaeon H-GB11]MEA5407168.1 KaiC domain-containing protein [Haloarculaceae archaeon H-GB2-1]
MSEDEPTDDEDDWFESALKDAKQDTQSDTADAASDDEGEPDDAAGASPFDDADDASSFGEDTESSPFGDADESNPFDDSSDIDTSDKGDDGSLFEDDFAAEMESVGGPNLGGGGDGGGFGGGGGGFGGGSSESFDDEDFESDIPRLDVGIEGLDNMIHGGIPKRHLIVTIGGAGTGKTTFGLQFLHHGLTEAGDNAVFITLEQTYEDIMATAAERDWEFDRFEEEGRLAVIDLDPVEMANSLDNIRGELPRLIEDFGADRFVLDSVSLLEMMYDDQSRRRTEVFDFTQSLKDAGVTTLFTSEAKEDNPHASRHGIIEYLTDAVFLLKYVRADSGDTQLAVEIQKIRNANHSRGTVPYEIEDDGLAVYESAQIF